MRGQRNFTSGCSRPAGTTRRGLLAGLGLAAVGFSLAGCGRSDSRRLNFHNWDTYIGKTTLADFEQATGARVNASYFANGDELFAKLRTGNSGYDVVVPANDMVTRMVVAGLLEPLDMAAIPNFRNILPAFQRADYDGEVRHSVPYVWGVLGIGYRRSKVEGVPDSWKWLYDSERYAGRIALISEAGDLVRIGAKYLGKSLVGVDAATARDVGAMLTRQKPRIKRFHDDDGQDLLAAGDVDLVLEYNGDIAQVMAEDPDLAFVVPREGSLLYTDTLAIPKNAPEPGLAHDFINFLLDGEVGKGIVETINYPTPNAAARALMPAFYRENPTIFPAGEGMDRSEFARFEGADLQRVYEDVITRMRAA
ncbi:MAG: spermidine/putrescine ABC transporter substrate-binding protein [Sphingomonadaceae bacterium]